MKLSLLIIALLPVITFRACDDLQAHDDVSLELDTVYSGGELSLTPYVLYSGEEDATFRFGSSIAWIDKVKKDDDVIYEYEEEAVDVDQTTTLENDEERTGFTVDLDVDPGIYEVHMTAQYILLNGEEEMDGEDGLEEYKHTRTQSVEVRSESDSDSDS